MVTFTLYPYLEDKPLKASTVFTSIALFNQITVPLYIVPLVIPMLISAIVSNRRLSAYFTSREIQSDKRIQWKKEPIRRVDLDQPNSAPILESESISNEKSSLNHHRTLDRCLSVAVASRPLSMHQHQQHYFDHFCCYIKSM